MEGVDPTLVHGQPPASRARLSGWLSTGLGNEGHFLLQEHVGIAERASRSAFAVRAGIDWSVVTTQRDLLLKFDSEDLSPTPGLAWPPAVSRAPTAATIRTLLLASRELTAWGELR